MEVLLIFFFFILDDIVKQYIPSNYSISTLWMWQIRMHQWILIFADIINLGNYRKRMVSFPCRYILSGFYFCFRHFFSLIFWHLNTICENILDRRHHWTISSSWMLESMRFIYQYLWKMLVFIKMKVKRFFFQWNSTDI